MPLIHGPLSWEKLKAALADVPPTSICEFEIQTESTASPSGIVLAQSVGIKLRIDIPAIEAEPVRPVPESLRKLSIETASRTSRSFLHQWPD